MGGTHVDVVEDQDHPEITMTRTDPAELAWHLYRHHGQDLSGLAGAEFTTLWDLHEQHHAQPWFHLSAAQRG